MLSGIKLVCRLFGDCHEGVGCVVNERLSVGLGKRLGSFLGDTNRLDTSTEAPGQDVSVNGRWSHARFNIGTSRGIPPR